MFGRQGEDGSDGVEDALRVAGQQVGAGAGDVQLSLGSVGAHALLLKCSESTVGMGEGVRCGPRAEVNRRAVVRVTSGLAAEESADLVVERAGVVEGGGVLGLTDCDQCLGAGAGLGPGIGELAVKEDRDSPGRLVRGTMLGVLDGLTELTVPEGEFAAGGTDPGVQGRVACVVGTQQSGARVGLGLGTVTEVAGHPGEHREQVTSGGEQFPPLVRALVPVEQVPDAVELELGLLEDPQWVVGHQIRSGEVLGVGGELFERDGATVGDLRPLSPLCGFLSSGLDKFGTGEWGRRLLRRGRWCGLADGDGARRSRFGLVAQDPQVGFGEGLAVV